MLTENVRKYIDSYKKAYNKDKIKTIAYTVLAGLFICFTASAITDFFSYQFISLVDVLKRASIDFLAVACAVFVLYKVKFNNATVTSTLSDIGKLVFVSMISVLLAVSIDLNLLNLVSYTPNGIVYAIVLILLLLALLSTVGSLNKYLFFPASLLLIAPFSGDAASVFITIASRYILVYFIFNFIYAIGLHKPE